MIHFSLHAVQESDDPRFFFDFREQIYWLDRYELKQVADPADLVYCSERSGRLYLGKSKIIEIASTGLKSPLPINVALQRVAFVLNNLAVILTGSQNPEIEKVEYDSVVNFLLPTFDVSLKFSSSSTIMTDFKTGSPKGLGEIADNLLAKFIASKDSQEENESLPSGESENKISEPNYKIEDCLQHIFTRYANHLIECITLLKKKPTLYASWRACELVDPVYNFSIGLVSDLVKRIHQCFEECISYFKRIERLDNRKSFFDISPDDYTFDHILFTLSFGKRLRFGNSLLKELLEHWSRFPQLRYEIERLKNNEISDSLVHLVSEVKKLKVMLDSIKRGNDYSVKTGQKLTEEEMRFCADFEHYLQRIKLFEVADARN